jgi:uncharacterized protein
MNCEFIVEGMHCAACELLIEKKLSKFPGVKKVDANLAENKVYLEFANNVDREETRIKLSELIIPEGYQLQEAMDPQQIKYQEYLWAGIITLVLITLFILLQKSSLIANGTNRELSLPAVFVIGVVASLSTCMAVVGGLVLSLSSNYAKSGQTKPLLLFHLSRLISFFIFGGIIGLAGSAFMISIEFNFVLNIVLFIVMLILGLNLFGLFPHLRKFQFRLPKIFGKTALKLDGSSSIWAATILGASTFMLPCGFTQSMQLYSLTTGNFWQGAITMFVFALGTFPVLALISFISTKFSAGLKSGIFFKTAGMLVIAFAIFNLMNSLVLIGAINPIF